MNILIVDDHILFAEGLKYLLESLDNGSTIHYAGDAESAIQHVLEHGTPNLILLDVNLPGMNGYDLLEKLHQLNIYRQEHYIVFCSSCHSILNFSF